MAGIVYFPGTKTIITKKDVQPLSSLIFLYSLVKHMHVLISQGEVIDTDNIFTP